MGRVSRNRDGSRTILKSKGRAGQKKAIAIWTPKNSKKGKVLVTTKKWMTKKQARAI